MSSYDLAQSLSVLLMVLLIFLQITNHNCMCIIVIPFAPWTIKHQITQLVEKRFF